MNATEKYNLLQNHIDDIFQLLNTYKSNMMYDYLDDYVKLIMIQGMLTTAQELVRSESLIYIMLDNCIQENDEKGKTIVFRGFMDYAKNMVTPCVKDLLEVANTWEFEDYKSRSFQNDLKGSMKLLWDIYKIYEEI